MTLALNSKGEELSESEIIHSPFFPEYIRSGDRISVTVFDHQTGREIEGLKLWRISPLGAELAAPAGQAVISSGHTIDVVLKYLHDEVLHRGLVVDTTFREKQFVIIGVRWLSDETTHLATGGERRETMRWLCGREFAPTGIAPNRLRFNDFIHFQAVDFSKSGMRIVTSMRNKLLVPGMTLQGIMTFPTIGDSAVCFKIAHARVQQTAGKEHLVLGCEFINPDGRLLKLVGQHLLQFGNDVNVKSLAQQGFEVQSVASCVSFSYVKRREEYGAVLDLRRRAWIKKGNFVSDTPKDAFGDRFDARSRILLATYNGRAIGSLRIVFPDTDGDYEHEQYIEMPADLPPQDQLVEITRVVVDPEYGGSDLLYMLFHQAALTCLQAGRRYIIGNSEAKLLPLYQKFGFETLPLSFDIAKLGIRATLFLGDIHKAFSGKNVGPIIWNILYGDLIEFVTEHDILQFDPMAKIRLAIYKLFRPLAMWLKGRMQNKKRGGVKPKRAE